MLDGLTPGFHPRSLPVTICRTAVTTDEFDFH
jgi:hypothetical protein